MGEPRAALALVQAETLEPRGDVRCELCPRGRPSSSKHEHADAAGLAVAQARRARCGPAAAAAAPSAAPIGAASRAGRLPRKARRDVQVLSRHDAPAGSSSRPLPARRAGPAHRPGSVRAQKSRSRSSALDASGRCHTRVSRLCVKTRRTRWSAATVAAHADRFPVGGEVELDAPAASGVSDVHVHESDRLLRPSRRRAPRCPSRRRPRRHRGAPEPPWPWPQPSPPRPRRGPRAPRSDTPSSPT